MLVPHGRLLRKWLSNFDRATGYRAPPMRGPVTA